MKNVRLVVVVVVVLLAAGGIVVWQLTKDDDATKGEQTVEAIQPAPFTAGLAFREPPVLRSSHKRLRGTIVAKNGTVEVSGLRVHDTQSFGVSGEPRGLLGPTLRVQPGDLVDLVLDNELVQLPQIATFEGFGGTTTVAAKASADPMDRGECAHDTAISPGAPQPTNFHFHGLHVTPLNHRVGNVTYYGDNVLACLKTGRSHIRFRIPSTHDRGTFWYHAHMHGLTDDQVFRGLAGMIVIGDSREYLPSRFRHIRQRIVSLKDIQVTKDGDGQAIPTDHDWANPTHRTVNGLVDPTMTMRPGETQLWRLANTSAAVWYRVVVANGAKRDPFTTVAQDGNPMALPQRVTQVLLAPGHRVDVLVRAPASGTRILKTLPFDQGRLIFGADVLATVQVKGPPAPRIASLHSTGTLPTFPSKRGPTRVWVFSTYFPKNQNGQFLINGKLFDPHRVDAYARLGTTEHWVLLNTSSEWHPFHIHQDDFRVVAINGKRVHARGDQDVVPIPPIDANGNPGRVDIEMPFERFSGDFVFHCHILDHEDAGMMARINVRR